MNAIPVMVSASDLQRSPSMVMGLVDNNDRVLVLNNNKPRMAMIKIDKYQTLLNWISTLEEQSFFDAVRIGELELSAGKLKTTTDFSEFLKDD